VYAEGLRGSRTLPRCAAAWCPAFEVAVLDALGHELGAPVHALLGGKVRDRVDYSAYLFYRWAEHPEPGEPTDDWGAALDPAGVVAQAQRFARDYGFTSFKLKGGVFAPAEEVAAIEALHEASRTTRCGWTRTAPGRCLPVWRWPRHSRASRSTWRTHLRTANMAEVAKKTPCRWPPTCA